MIRKVRITLLAAQILEADLEVEEGGDPPDLTKDEEAGLIIEAIRIGDWHDFVVESVETIE